MAEFRPGDVLKYNDENTLYVLVKCIIRERSDTAAYNRDYYLLPYDSIDEHKETEETELLSLCRKIHLEGWDVRFPFTGVDNVTPFKMEQKIICSFKKKQPKQITIYE